jgi:hypothetical protein
MRCRLSDIRRFGFGDDASALLVVAEALLFEPGEQYMVLRRKRMALDGLHVNGFFEAFARLVGSWQ